MPRKRGRLIGWTYNEETQEIQTPHGRTISVHDIATMLADHRDCRIDLTGNGQVGGYAQQWLIAPGGTYGNAASHTALAADYRMLERRSPLQVTTTPPTLSTSSSVTPSRALIR